MGKLERRRYVAYLVADGNGMGTWFSRCDKEALRQLSQQLPTVLRESLAAPCPDLLRRVREIPRSDPGLLPVLPLILGGDDLFALLPAAWALDFAAVFCREFEQRMAGEFERIGLSGGGAAAAGPTMAAAVVICKANYPYALAHRRGETLLARAKQFARGLELRSKRRSVITFDVLTGNPADPDAELPAGELRPSLAPYYAATGLDDEYGIALQWLLEHRFALRSLPGRRRAELERLYDARTVPPKRTGTDFADWINRLAELRARLGRLEETGLHPLVETALRELGQADKAGDFWRRLDRPGAEGVVYVHGLPDLLRAWDFAYRLDVPLSAYEAD